MGSASSKAARKFPKTTKASWAGARTPGPTDMQPQQPSARSGIPPEAQRASETRTEAIEQDSRDPQFLQRLNQLGPVKVDHHMRTFRPGADLARHVYETRLQSEIEAHAAQTPHNHLLASSLSNLLEDLKYTKSREELASLAHRYNIDIAKIQGIARFVNTPTVDPATVVRTMGKDGVEKVTMQVMWKDAPFQR